MEPNKIEKDFKEKLEQRTIQPSEMAWDRLDAMLSVAEKKKPGNKRAWMYMAAAFLVFLLAGAFLLNREKETNGIDTDNSVVTRDAGQEDAGEAAIAPVPNENAVAVKETVKKGIRRNAGLNTKVKEPEYELVQATTEEPFIAQDNAPVPADETLLAAATVNEAPKKKKSGIKVDPNSLLSAVEEELDQSFKNRVLIGTVRNFNTVKSAVANRNYE